MEQDLRTSCMRSSILLNPSPMTMRARRRQQLVSVDREHGALIITDDVYGQLQRSASRDST